MLEIGDMMDIGVWIKEGAKVIGEVGLCGPSAESYPVPS